MENNHMEYVECLGEMKELKSKLYQDIIVVGLKDLEAVYESLDGITELCGMIKKLMDLTLESEEGSPVKVDGIKYTASRVNDMDELTHSVKEQQALMGGSKLYN